MKKNQASKRKVSRKSPASNAFTNKLTRLRARQKAARQKIQEAGLSSLDPGPLQDRWSKLLRQANAHELTFVRYQGQDIEALAVNVMSGDVSINERSYIEGEERLHRDESGQYYFYRNESNEQVHAVSLTTAILWAITRANPNTNHLRADAVRALAQKGGAK